MRTPPSDTLVSLGQTRIARAAAGHCREADRWFKLHEAARCGQIRDPAEGLRANVKHSEAVMEQLLSTREAAAVLGWPVKRLHEAARLVPEFPERRVGCGAGPKASNEWPAETVEIVRILQELAFGYTEAVRIACMARLVDGKVVIDPGELSPLQS